MFYLRRRQRSSSTPPLITSVNPSAALSAASSVYHPAKPPPSPTLAAAAAGAALRNASASPPPPSQCIGSIPTKRMLQRRDSYSSITSNDQPARPALLQRRNSSGSLAERRFRKEKKEKTDFQALVSNNKGKGRGTSEPPPMRRLGASDKKGGVGIGTGRYSDSVTSFSSDLDSIAEGDERRLQKASSHRRKRNIQRTTLPVVETDDEDGGAALERTETPKQRHRQQTTANKHHSQDSSLLLSPSSPTRAHFAPDSPTKLVKHSPPPRSLSPTKSALKTDHDRPASRASTRRSCAQVSFSDEDSMAEFSNSRPPVVSLEEIGGRPQLPVFGRTQEDRQNAAAEVRRWSRGLSQKETKTVSPPLSDDEEEVFGIRNVLLRQKREERTTSSDGLVPELVVTLPTPIEEKAEPKHTKEFPPSPPTEGNDETSDNDSIYSDAFESLPRAPPPVTTATVTPLRSALSPTSPTSTIATTAVPFLRNPSPLNDTPRPPSPPLPADFAEPTPTPTRRRSLTPPPTRRRSTRQRTKITPTPPPPPTQVDYSSDSSSESLSDSSFRRSVPRLNSRGFRSTMRSGGEEGTGSRASPRMSVGRKYPTDSEVLSPAPRAFRSSMRIQTTAPTGEWRSRFADDSDSDAPVKKGKLRLKKSKEKRKVTYRRPVTPSPAPAPVPDSLRTLREPPNESLSSIGDNPKKKKEEEGFWPFRTSSKAQAHKLHRDAPALDVSFRRQDGEVDGVGVQKHKGKWWKFGKA